MKKKRKKKTDPDIFYWQTHPHASKTEQNITFYRKNQNNTAEIYKIIKKKNKKRENSEERLKRK